MAAFHPYRRSVLHKETTIASLERIADALRRTHNGFYYDLRKVHEPVMAKADSSTKLAGLPLPPSAAKRWVMGSWVTLRARWVTLRARWVMLRAAG